MVETKCRHRSVMIPECTPQIGQEIFSFGYREFHFDWDFVLKFGKKQAYLPLGMGPIVGPVLTLGKGMMSLLVNDPSSLSST